MVEPQIIYGEFSRSLAFYSNKQNIIFLNNIIKEDEKLEKHAIKHEKGHDKLYQSHSNRVILLILNLCLDYWDWVWFLFHLDLAIQNEKLSAKLPLQRTKDDELYIDIVKNFPSSEWFFQKLYEFFKPDVFPFYLLCVCILFLFKLNNLLIVVFTLFYILFGYSFFKKNISRAMSPVILIRA